MNSYISKCQECVLCHESSTSQAKGQIALHHPSHHLSLYYPHTDIQPANRPNPFTASLPPLPQTDNYGTSFFCRMRMYHGLRSSGFGVKNKRTIYKPCKMVLKFHDPTCLDETASTCGPNSSLLLAEVIPIQSVYQGIVEMYTYLYLSENGWMGRAVV